MRTCDSPFFIFCSASSGSTLLSTILDRHPDITIGPEMYVFNKDVLYEEPFSKLRQCLPRYLDKGVVGQGQVMVPEFFFNREAYFHDKSSIVTIASESDSVRELMDGFYAPYLQRRDKKIWGEKTGSDAYCGDRILAVYPYARFIHLVRDPVDTIVSVEKRTGNAFEAMSHYLYNHAAALRFQDHPAYLRVRYEDLVRNPQSELDRIVTHIGADAAVDLLGGDEAGDEYWTSTVDAGKNRHATWRNQPSGAISDTSVGKGREVIGMKHRRIAANLGLSRAGLEMLNMPSNTTLSFNQVAESLGYPPVEGPSANIDLLIVVDWLKRARRRGKCGQWPVRPLFRSLRTNSDGGETASG